MAEDKELQHLKNRMTELAARSYQNNIYTFTPFLGLSEQQAFHEIKREVAYAGYGMEGGSPLCERRMLRFGNPDLFGYETPYPIRCLCVEPLTPKFAERLSHRDFLGAIMNLGIERDTVGDIFPKDHEAVIFCQESIADYLIENLTQVRRTRVTCSAGEAGERIQTPDAEQVSLSVSSARIDTVVSKLYNIARSRSAELFAGGKVYVNGKLTENNSYALKDNDAVTVRGFGRFVYTGEQGETRKGKVRIGIEVYR